jgi:phosphate transport system protein
MGMLKQLVQIFRGEHPLQTTSRNFNQMLRLAQEMVNEASTLFWGGEQTPEQRTALYAKDVEVNKLERAIRKHIIAHLSGPVPSDVPYCLLIMSLVKDLERLGDYAKNLSELVSLADEPFPDDANLGELREIARSVERLASEAGRVFANADRDRAKELTLEGRSVAKRCEELVRKVAHSDYSANVAVRLTLAARHYKRLEAHLLNLLSGILMPLHKLDYYDENAL